MTFQLQVTRQGGPEVLKLIETPDAPLPAGHLRIKVKAAGVNFADLMMRMGLYPEAPKTPFTPGYEIAGEVIEIGSDVHRFKMGDRVLSGTKFGGYTSQAVLPEYGVRKIPSTLSYEEAAGILVNFLTAATALEEMGRVRAGDRVLIPSAAGGVGTAAVQIAAKAGAQVTGLVSSKAKVELVRSLGASRVMDYNEWNNLNEKEGYQIILDATGGASLKRAFKRLAPTGRLITFGASSIVQGSKRSLKDVLSLALNTALFTPYQLMAQNKGVFGLNMLQLFDHPGSEKTSQMLKVLDRILNRFEKGDFKVILGKTFSLEKGGEAHDWLQNRSNTGKVVLIPPT